jgi:hypothetical protein
LPNCHCYIVGKIVISSKILFTFFLAMETVLRIPMDMALAQKATVIAAKYNQDIEQLIREYLIALTAEFIPSPATTPVLASLAGIVQTELSVAAIIEDARQERHSRSIK